MSPPESLLHKVTANEWTWHLKDPAALNPWFFSLKESIGRGTVKKNNVRTVFVADSELGRCFVKYERPNDWRGCLKAFFRSKALAELNSAQILAEHGVPVVEYWGWGRRGTETMLISKALVGAVDARFLWFSGGLQQNERLALLDGLAAFLRGLLESNLYHPDLHLGNLLVLPDQKKFVLVDPYGIRPIRWKTQESFQMLRLAGAMRGELSAQEAASFLIKTGTESDAPELWARIVAAETEEMQRLWPKRREQILSGSKYCTLLTLPGGRIAMLRHNINGAAMLSVELLSNGSEWDYSEKKELPRIDAEALWLASFQLQFERAPQPLLPVLWEQHSDGPDIIYFKKNT